MRALLKYFNGFIVIGIMLFFISIAGAATGNRLLTEPGSPINPYAWLEYMVAAALMLVNGAVSIRLTMNSAPQATKQTEKSEDQENSQS